MNLLIDSHVFVWMHETPNRLSAKSAVEIVNPANSIFLSIASVWELQIKIKLGKFSFSDKLEKVIAIQQQTNDVELLPIQLSHVIYLENLQLHHKDPFDRLLISQALAENLTLVSSDPQFPDYGVNLLW